MDFLPRYERKFRIEAAEASADEVLAAVRGLPALFRAVHPERIVCSLYLDTPDRQAFHAATAGLPERVKPRLRWYEPVEGTALSCDGNDLFQTPHFELKRRHGLVGTKELLALPAWPPTPGRGAWRAYAVAHPWLAQHPELEPVVLVRYRRAYLVSADGRLRLTLDRALRYAPATPDLRPPLPAAWVPDSATVLELKYPVGHPADALPQVPFRLTRNSKYVSAVLNTSG